MNHSQIEKNGMYKKMLIFFANPLNSIVWATFTRLVDEIANFVAENITLSNYMQQHESDIRGITTEKNISFDDMVSITVNKAQKAYVWAVDTKNVNLMKIFDIQISDFSDSTQTSAFNRIRNVRDMLNTNIAAMASVQLVAADVTAVSTAITTYQNSLGTVGAAKAHKTEGTQGLVTIMQTIDTSLGLIDNLMMSSYTTTNVDMMKEYVLNRSLDKIATHHNGVSVHVSDAVTGTDLEGALVATTDKSSTTDIDGIGELIKLKVQTCNVSVTMPNYVTQTIKMDIIRGKITHLEVKLVKVG